MHRFIKDLFKAGEVLCISLLLAQGLSSCMKDEILGLQDRVDKLEMSVGELKAQLNSEIAAVKDIVNGLVTISGYEYDVTTGNTKIKLSSGVEFIIYPSASQQLSPAVTFVELGPKGKEVKYWAYIDAEGKRQLILDSKGDRVPVLTATPQVVTHGDKNFLVIDGVEYPLSGNSAFSGYKVNNDPLSGNPVSVTFDLEGLGSFTVDIDREESPLKLMIQMGFQSIEVSEYYIPYNASQVFDLVMEGVSGFMTQAPQGWLVKENRDGGFTTLEVKTPSLAKVQDQSALPEGYLKINAGLSGGGSYWTEAKLTTNPFSSFSISGGVLNATRTLGLQKFVYGLCPATEFDKTKMLDLAREYVDSYEPCPAGMGVAEEDIVNLPLADIAGQPLQVGSDYVLWVLPAAFDFVGEEGWSLDADNYYIKEFNHFTATLELSDITYKNATLNMSLTGADSYYGSLIQVETTEEDALNDIITGINSFDYSVHTGSSYEGSAFAFGDSYYAPETEMTYLVWMVVPNTDGVYTTGDIVYKSFTIPAIAAGGTLKVTATPTVSYKDISVAISSKGAGMMAYAFLPRNSAGRYNTDELKASYLLESGRVIGSSEATVKLSYFPKIKIRPGAAYAFFAMAIDNEGKYGEVLSAEYTTDNLVFNPITLALTTVTNEPKNIVLNVKTTGGSATEYLYWVGLDSDVFWTGKDYLGGTLKNAEEFMYLHSNDAHFSSSMSKYPLVGETLSISNVPAGKKVICVIMAKDASGQYSHASQLLVESVSISLGDIIPASDSKWESHRPTIEWLAEEFTPQVGMKTGSYAFNISFPTDVHAYVVCASEQYFAPGGNSTLTTEQLMRRIISEADKQRDHSNYIEQPDGTFLV